ncbi:MAG: MBL fold metallo-hydrolase [Defluviitaleaceae bacterium]|nr:MBL fold metallo-hydrolase [Defluviitaleaceae bacterium]
MKIQCLPTSTYSSNTFVYYDEDSREGCVIDPGGDSDKIIAFLREHGIKVGRILLTHGHFDHIMAVYDVAEFTGAKIAAGADECPLLADPGLNLSKQALKTDFSVTPDITLADGDTVSVGGAVLRVITTPGHTPGCVCFYNEAEELVFTGDTLFRESVGRADLPGGDSQVMEASLRTKLYTLPPGTTVYPGHMQPTTIGHEIEHNPYVRP